MDTGTRVPDLSTVTELLDHIAGLPPAQAAEATARVDVALEGPANSARIALGILALDLVGDDDDDVLVVPELHSLRVSA
ncbi:MAG: hypothetical protein WD670_00995 [Actinomycetota bacterium]